jgi:hypothetical protein
MYTMYGGEHALTKPYVVVTRNGGTTWEKKDILDMDSKVQFDLPYMKCAGSGASDSVCIADGWYHEGTGSAPYYSMAVFSTDGGKTWRSKLVEKSDLLVLDVSVTGV